MPIPKTVVLIVSGVTVLFILIPGIWAVFGRTRPTPAVAGASNRVHKLKGRKEYKEIAIPLPHAQATSPRTISIDLDLNGLCLLSGKAAAVYLLDSRKNQHWTGLLPYVRNCHSGVQTVEIPVSAIKRQTDDLDLTEVRFTFWYPTDFEIDVISINTTGAVSKNRPPGVLGLAPRLIDPSVPDISPTPVPIGGTGHEPTPASAVPPSPTSASLVTPTPSPVPTGIAATPVPTQTPSPSPQPARTPTPTPVPVNYITPSPTTLPSPTPSRAPTPTLRSASTPTPLPTRNFTPTPTPSRAPSPTRIPTATMRPTAAPTPTPAQSRVGSWEIRSVSSMKETKDRLCSPAGSDYISRWVGAAARLGVNYIAVETPYDSPACGDSLAYTRAWINQIRSSNIRVWHRHMPLAFEGIYDTPKTGGRDYISQITDYIKANPDIFQPGDIFTPVPEPQNGGISGISYCAQGVCIFSGVSEFNVWLRRAMDESEKAFASIGLAGRIKIGYWGFDGFVAWGHNNPDWNGLLEDATVARMGNITIDHYPELVGTSMSRDLDELQARYPGVPIIIGEWGTATGGDIENQVRSSMQAARRPGVVGFSYWHMGMGGHEALVNSDFTPRPQYDEVREFFTSP